MHTTDGGTTQQPDETQGNKRVKTRYDLKVSLKIVILEDNSMEVSKSDVKNNDRKNGEGNKEMVIKFVDDDSVTDNMSGLSRSLGKPWNAGSMAGIEETNYGFQKMRRRHR